jgi:hypothetical protein
MRGILVKGTVDAAWRHREIASRLSETRSLHGSMIFVHSKAAKLKLHSLGIFLRPNRQIAKSPSKVSATKPWTFSGKAQTVSRRRLERPTFPRTWRSFMTEISQCLTPKPTFYIAFPDQLHELNWINHLHIAITAISCPRSRKGKGYFCWELD